MLQTLTRSRGHLCEFLPKFHCDINWAENHWGKSKPCVRQLVDGGWMKMSVTVIRVGHPGYFIHISITTPIVSALKNYYR